MQKNMTKGQEMKPSVEGDPEVIQMVELSDRDLKVTMKKNNARGFNGKGGQHA